MKLNNGATVLKKVDEKVLALWSGEFVIWSVGPDGDAYWGSYFKDDLDTALKVFNEKTS